MSGFAYQEPLSQTRSSTNAQSTSFPASSSTTRLSILRAAISQAMPKPSTKPAVRPRAGRGIEMPAAARCDENSRQHDRTARSHGRADGGGNDGAAAGERVAEATRPRRRSRNNRRRACRTITRAVAGRRPHRRGNSRRRCVQIRKYRRDGCGRRATMNCTASAKQRQPAAQNPVRLNHRITRTQVSLAHSRRCHSL